VRRRVFLIQHLGLDDVREALRNAPVDVPWTLHTDYEKEVRVRSLRDVAKRLDVPLSDRLYGMNRMGSHVHVVAIRDASAFASPSTRFVLIMGTECLEKSIREIEVMSVMGS
jgi:hypothetical protein